MNFSLALPPNQYGCGYQAWRYAPWREAFYPKGLIQKRELEFVSRALPTIELNGSFYALQRPSSYLRWYEQTSLGFIFSVKATRYITHVLRLRDIEQSMANFFASGLLSLKEKLGPNIEDITTDFIYLRLHGAEELYASGYTDEALDDWASRIEAWSEGAQPKNAHLISSQASQSRIPRCLLLF